MSTEKLGAGLRLTASDRPGIAQPVPERDIPSQPWARILVVATVLAVLLLAGWEWRWREYGNEPATRNSDGLWSMQRRRIDTGEGGKTVIIGSSRVLFDIDLDTWQRLSGERPIQLALEGTTPAFALDDLADDLKFTGKLIIGVAPELFFSGFGYRKSAFKLYHREGPALRIGQWLSMHIVEPVFAFYDEDFALATVVRRQEFWPLRPGSKPNITVRKLAVTQADRNTSMWHKVVDDPEYRALAQKIWSQKFGPPDEMKRKGLAEALPRELARVAKAVATLKARGVEMVFVREPSIGPYYAFERIVFPREKTWDVVLAQTGVRGIHFEDHPELQGYDLPEWSHLAPNERPRFTEALYQLVVAKPEASLP